MNNANIKTSWLVKTPIAHRGFHSATIPENSLAAFEHAISCQLAIELDVHLLADGSVVVFHDHELERLTGKKGPLTQQTHETLQPLRLLGTDEKIPLLPEVLEFVNGRVPLLIELKNLQPTVGLLENAVLNDLKNYHGEFALQSFNPISLRYLRDQNPHIWLGQLWGEFVKVEIEWWKDADFFADDINGLPNPRITQLRKQGLPILAWTVKNSEQLATACTNADNIIFEDLELGAIQC